MRLVTTNFDLLFEAAAPKATVWTPARLPQTREIASFEGIVHLHGVFDNAYQEPVGGSFVLSSAEFGRAYLAEGWATAFIRSVMDNYRIVFVGYAADDPPVQYLLEALSGILPLRACTSAAASVGQRSRPSALARLNLDKLAPFRSSRSAMASR